MQPTRGEASSLPILPLLSFPVNLALDFSFTFFFHSFFLLSSLLHLTSPQLINYLYYISSRLELVISFYTYLITYVASIDTNTSTPRDTFTSLRYRTFLLHCSRY